MGFNSAFKGLNSCALLSIVKPCV